MCSLSCKYVLTLEVGSMQSNLTLHDATVLRLDFTVDLYSWLFSHQAPKTKGTLVATQSSVMADTEIVVERSCEWP